MKKLPDRIRELRGNHETAIKMAQRIPRYLEEVIAALEAAKDMDGKSSLAAGHLRHADDRLETVARHATAVRRQLRIAYCEPSDDEEVSSEVQS